MGVNTWSSLASRDSPWLVTWEPLLVQAESGAQQLAVLSAGSRVSRYCSTGYSLRRFLNGRPATSLIYLLPEVLRRRATRDDLREIAVDDGTARLYHRLTLRAVPLLLSCFLWFHHIIRSSSRIISLLSHCELPNISSIRKLKSMRNTARELVFPSSCSPNNISALSNIAHIPWIHQRAHITFEAARVGRVWLRSSWIYCTVTTGFNCLRESECVTVIIATYDDTTL